MRNIISLFRSLPVVKTFYFFITEISNTHTHTHTHNVSTPRHTFSRYKLMQCYKSDFRMSNRQNYQLAISDNQNCREGTEK